MAMRIALARLLRLALLFNVMVPILILFIFCEPQSYRALAQYSASFKEIPVDFVSEQGCPVVVTSAKTKLDLDPFGAPKAARIYVTYKNVSDRPIAGVKFRLRYVDPAGKNRGTFHAPHAAVLTPGGTARQKWRSTRIYPNTSGVKLRVLMVRYNDGSEWQSIRAKNIVVPGGASENAPAGQPGGDAFAGPPQ